MNKTLRYSLIGASVAAVAFVGYKFFMRQKLMKELGLDKTEPSKGGGSNSSGSKDKFPLKVGSTGPNVKKLQEYLNKSSSAGLVTDGIFGSKTLAAWVLEQQPFSSFKQSYPEAVEGQVSEKYFNQNIK
jgi:peptidoglycan hydrolase-like protein with peptidoglycan-binding domain